KNNLRISVHVPWNANPLQPDAGRIISEHICFAKDMGASLINIHLYTDSGIDAFIESIIPYFDDLAQNRISLAIENTPLTTPDNFNELFEKILKSGHPALSNAGMCLDIGHANLCSPTINDYIRYLDLLEPHVPINHVHLHENYGDCDSHLCLFTGPSAQNTDGISLLIRRLHGRHFNGSLILEQWPEHPALLKQAVTRLRRMLGSVRKPKTRAEKLPIKDFAQQLSSADSRYHSWREKLCWIEKRLHNRKQPVNRDMLIYLAVYMRFIGTGALSCREDGGHYRPCHHTRLSKSIFDRLLELNNNDNSFIIRKIFPWLPSFDAAFSCAEPLTRIRDIAHRNDVPQDLKREIKHSLQNKLHRCAGPEDLDTSAALLARITAPETDCSVEFINEFQKFHAELKEFFNACTLEEDLETLTKHPCFSSGQDVTIVSDCIRSFCAFSRTEDTVSNISRHLTCLTELRTHLKKMESLQDLNQSITVIDCKLEDVAFMLAGKLLRLDAFSSAKPSLSES
ncbi:MAG: sugar phosphate isomerase/epimerase, partial [Deltaproteobacteria bacterium]|nr:sugar phosphate isomerase/epimerase [Deltaproteobacteria bacterium]